MLPYLLQEFLGLKPARAGVSFAISGNQSRRALYPMSAPPPIAAMLAAGAQFGSGPIAEVAGLFDHLVSAGGKSEKP
jgi:hypothetical protein